MEHDDNTAAAAIAIAFNITLHFLISATATPPPQSSMFVSWTIQDGLLPLPSSHLPTFPPRPHYFSTLNPSLFFNTHQMSLISHFSTLHPNRASLHPYPCLPCNKVSSNKILNFTHRQYDSQVPRSHLAAGQAKSVSVNFTVKCV
jgi:hypothetical protein